MNESRLESMNDLPMAIHYEAMEDLLIKCPEDDWGFEVAGLFEMHQETNVKFHFTWAWDELRGDMEKLQ